MTTKIFPHPTASPPPQGSPQETPDVDNEVNVEREDGDSVDRIGDEENNIGDDGQVKAEEVAAEDGKEVDDDKEGPPPRRGSIVDYIRRASVDAALEVGVQLGAIGPDTDDVMGEAGPTSKRPRSSIAVIDNPVSFWSYTFTSNVQGLASALPSCLLILLMTFVNDNLVKLGGFFGDIHVVRCFGCLLYMDVGFLVIRWDRAFTKRMLLCKVPGQITFMVAVSSAFDWKLGPWTFVVATLAFCFGDMCTYAIDMQKQPRPPMIKYMVKCLVTGFVMHGSIAFVISALIIPTKVLAEEENDKVTVGVTGIVFPGVIYLVRKILVSFIQKFVAGKEGWSNEKKVEMLTMMLSVGSLTILLTPSVLLYFNASVKYALYSALCQLFTEVVGKIWTVWATKKHFKMYIKELESNAGGKMNKLKVAVLKLSQEAGINHDVANERDGDIDSTELLRRALALLAIRYHTEIVAEKGCIIVACEIAFLFFRDQVNTSSADLILIGIVFYALEMVTDCIFVWVMHNMLDVPILAAVPHSNLLSASSLRMHAILSLIFVVMSNCIAMASSV
ncbi:hypothetical protein TrRE_jg11647 [Triparma retinervis]|uniref:Uncharacterized protein n=1 Tax=Triparma retinervis TaxID=2557542 RepID=A0A9W7AHC4_9STRA|nr:hypothetical protein TrRE_jg11647 [Triparma retinervis]